jgi:hypothetical protein
MPALHVSAAPAAKRRPLASALDQVAKDAVDRVNRRGDDRALPKVGIAAEEVVRGAVLQRADHDLSGEVRRWCDEAGLEVELESIEPAGITIVAKKLEERPL